MRDLFQDATILITGGTGSFGEAFLPRCLEFPVREIRVFSRDEKKQYDMMHRYENPVYALTSEMSATSRPLTRPWRGLILSSMQQP